MRPTRSKSWVLALCEINRYRQTGDVHDRCLSCGGMGGYGPVLWIQPYLSASHQYWNHDHHFLDGLPDTVYSKP